MKLKYDKPLSNLAFNFNLRPYSKEAEKAKQDLEQRFTKVGQCRLTPG